MDWISDDVCEQLLSVRCRVVGACCIAGIWKWRTFGLKRDPLLENPNAGNQDEGNTGQHRDDCHYTPAND